jgi:hypothetical protein
VPELMDGERAAAADEIERLRADLLTRDGQAQELQGELARLRGLLREWMDDSIVGRAHDLEKRTQKALGE